MKNEPVSISTLLMPVKRPIPRQARRQAASAAASTERGGARPSLSSPAGRSGLMPVIALSPRSGPQIARLSLLFSAELGVSSEAEVARGQARFLHMREGHRVAGIQRDDGVGADLSG